jgi:hypothetical protein
MYDEVIKRIDAKKIILDSLVAREDKKQAVIKADSLKLSKDTLTKKEVLLIKRGRVSEKITGIPCEFNKLSTLQV